MSATAFDLSYPYDAQTSAEDQWRDMFRQAPGSGVIAGVDNELLVIGDSTGRQVKVNTGRAWFAGQFGKVTSQKTIALTANSSGQPRIDRIIARNNFTANQIELDVLVGTPGASPSAPALTSNSSMQEFSLCQVTLANGYTTVPAQSTFPAAPVSGAPVDERCLISPYGTPGFADAAARTLWVPSPAVGFLASLRSTGGLYSYDGSSWLQRMRQPFSVPYSPSGNEDTGSNATWPTGLHASVAVPKWATRCRMSAKVGQVYAVTGVCNVGVTLQIDTLNVDAARIRWDNALVTSAQARDLVLAGDIDVSSLIGTTVTARTLGNVVSGSGGIRANTESTCFLEGEFR